MQMWAELHAVFTHTHTLNALSLCIPYGSHGKTNGGINHTGEVEE